LINEAIILAGGFGTRLKGVIKDLPKSLAPVIGRPFLEYQLNYLNNWGIQRVILAVGYKNELIREYFGNTYKSIKLDYSLEDVPLGTGGALKKALSFSGADNVLVMNGDTYFDVDLQSLYDFLHIKECGLGVTLRYVDDVGRYGSVEIDEKNRITGFTEKGQKQSPGYINGGVYLFDKRFFMGFNLPQKFSLEKGFLEKYCHKERIYGLCCNGYFLDIGIPEDYKKAQNEFKGFIR
jgi:D-glycero-alpha-D-manno-heptose 1-phosphate guanylyltransferase